jgi:tRNA uridine 5-carboxymethylaminomethyl modification enzyme
VLPEEINPILEANDSSKIEQSMKMFKIAARPQLNFTDLRKLAKVEAFVIENNIDREIEEQTEIHVKYAGYIDKERNQADKVNRLENVSIPSNFDYTKVKSLSIEARQKLGKIQPITISQASRISGVSPSDISVLLVYMGR